MFDSQKQQRRARRDTRRLACGETGPPSTGKSRYHSTDGGGLNRGIPPWVLGLSALLW